MTDRDRGKILAAVGCAVLFGLLVPIGIVVYLIVRQ